MRPADLIRTIRSKLDDEGHWLTHGRLALFGVTLILTGLVAGFFETTTEIV